MPSVPGIRTSISTTSGRVFGGGPDRLVPVGRLADDLEARQRAQQCDESVPHDRMIVGHDDPDGPLVGHHLIMPVAPDPGLGMFFPTCSRFAPDLRERGRGIRLWADIRWFEKLHSVDHRRQQ